MQVLIWFVCMMRICDEELYEISIFSPKKFIHMAAGTHWFTFFSKKAVDVLNEICKENIDPTCMIEMLLSRLTLKGFSTIMKWQVIIFLRAYHCFATEILWWKIIDIGCVLQQLYCIDYYAKWIEKWKWFCIIWFDEMIKYAIVHCFYLIRLNKMCNG